MIEEVSNYLSQIRHDFTSQALNEEMAGDNPLDFYAKWVEEGINAKILDPKAIVISTVDSEGKPSSRVVYVRGIDANGFKFYTNYNSDKGSDLLGNPNISVNIFWPELERQIRMQGTASKLSSKESDTYFSGRPRGSQIGAWASNQSGKIKNRQALEKQVEFFTKKFEGCDVPRPDFWGGYYIEAHRFEFWQGRPSRLHDRIVFEKQNNEWIKFRVAP